MNARSKFTVIYFCNDNILTINLTKHYYVSRLKEFKPNSVRSKNNSTCIYVYSVPCSVNILDFRGHLEGTLQGIMDLAPFQCDIPSIIRYKKYFFLGIQNTFLGVYKLSVVLKKTFLCVREIYTLLLSSLGYGNMRGNVLSFLCQNRECVKGSQLVCLHFLIS